jgi:predicted AlkP superfamily pyrophosphatase or phosphodiesterase
MTRPFLKVTALVGASALLALYAASADAIAAKAPAATTAFAEATPAVTARGTAGDRAATKPSLIVLIAIDQFSADYLTRFGAQLHGGIGRLMAGGAWFTDAHHDHAITETAPGHATLLAGRFPRSTGIMMNSIGVEDETAPLIASGYGPGASPRRFQGTTLADWLRKADGKTRTLSVSMKDRAAILPNGRAPSDVYWYSPDGRFVTSSYYRKALPDWVNAYNARQQPMQYAGKSWTLLLPDSAYHEPDSVEVESSGKGFLFPHPLPDDGMDAANLVRATPFMDDIVASFALSGVRALELGAGERTDLLTMSLSATDVIGHRFGPDSREIHDQVLRVDGVIGRFLDSLYALRDSSAVTVILTADHGVGRIPELAAKTIAPDARRVSLESLLPAVRSKLRSAQVDTNAFAWEQNLVFIDRKAFSGKKLDPDTLLDFFAALARRETGVARVDRFKALLADSAKDPIARRWAHQFPATVNVEMLITLTPYSTWGGNVASHGSPYDYDSRVPIIFGGFGVQAGRYANFVRTVDIAPTLAAIAGVKPMEVIDGVALPQALRERTTSP